MSQGQAHWTLLMLDLQRHAQSARPTPLSAPDPPPPCPRPGVAAAADPPLGIADLPLPALLAVVTARGFTVADLVNAASTCKAWSRVLAVDDVWRALALAQFLPGLGAGVLPGCSSWRDRYRQLGCLVRRRVQQRTVEHCAHAQPSQCVRVLVGTAAGTSPERAAPRRAVCPPCCCHPAGVLWVWLAGASSGGGPLGAHHPPWKADTERRADRYQIRVYCGWLAGAGSSATGSRRRRCRHRHGAGCAAPSGDAEQAGGGEEPASGSVAESEAVAAPQQGAAAGGDEAEEEAEEDSEVEEDAEEKTYRERADRFGLGRPACKPALLAACG